MFVVRHNLLMDEPKPKSENRLRWVHGNEEDCKPEVDLVLVQGLNAHHHYTWVGYRDLPENNKRKFDLFVSGSSSKKNPEAEVFWPKDLLPQKLPNSRIGTYSYPSDWTSRGFKASLRECGEQFLNVLHQHKQGHIAGRPLVLIGHSLGGLVIQQALVIAAINDNFSDISKCIAGAIFLGAPMQGSDSAYLLDWAMLALRNEQPLLRSLRSGSEELLALSRDFWGRYGSLQIICFFERQESSYTPLGLKAKTVTPQSASVASKRTMHLNTTHSEMNKFRGEDDENFLLLLPEIQATIKHAISRHHEITQEPEAKLVLPFLKDNDFVGRENELSQIDEIFQSKAAPDRVALVGLGGVGKSQIAIEYAYRHRSKFPDTSVFWVYASNPTRFQTSYATIALQLRIPGFDDAKTDQIALVFNWLSSNQSGGWLMILDNADDVDFMRTHNNSAQPSPHSFSASQYLPRRSGAKILITSRNMDAAFGLVGHNKFVINVAGMDMEQSRSLLRVRIDEPAELLDELSSTLEYIPLALVQASAYIAKRSRISISKYLKLLASDEDSEISLLNTEDGSLRRDEEVPNSVLKTWQVSFDQIRKQNPQAADLLSCMCFFDRQGIPDFLLQAHRTAIEFGEGIDILLGYSIIEADSDATSFQMHRLVQLATTVWLRTQDQTLKFAEEALSMLEEEYPVPEYENWSICQSLEPHAQSILQSKILQDHPRLFRASLLNLCGQYACDQGHHAHAEAMQEKALRDTAAVVGEEHDQRRNITYSLAITYTNQGRWDDAERLQIKVLEIERGLIGEEHPDTLRTMSSLASVYQQQGQWGKAEELGTQVLEIRKRVLGIEHPSTLISMAILALVYQQQGQWGKAEELGTQVLEVSKRVLGVEHPNTLTSMSNLALVYQQQGQWGKAEELGTQVLEVSKRVLGVEHPSTLISMAILASVYQQQGQWGQAEELGTQVLEIQKRVLGVEHPDTLTSMSNLATVYQQQGQWGQAEELGTQVLEIRKRVLGIEHPSTLISMANLALVYEQQGQLTEAVELQTKVLDVREKLFGVEHPGTLRAMSNLSVTYSRQGHLEKSEELHYRVLDIRKRVLGVEHPDTLLSMANLAVSYADLGRLGDAIVLMSEAHEGRMRKLGPDHPNTIDSGERLLEWRSEQEGEETTQQRTEEESEEETTEESDLEFEEESGEVSDLEEEAGEEESESEEGPAEEEPQAEAS